jgi:hypothetical protein
MDGRKSQGEIGSFGLASSGAFPQTVRLLAPHEWYLGTMWGMDENSRTKNTELECALKVSDNFEAILIGLVGADSPIVGHIHKTHTLQTK